MFIDPPSPFAPLEEWVEFLAAMKAVDRRNDDILRHIAEAETVVARLLAETGNGDDRPR